MQDETTINIFHRWNAELDLETRTVTFYVSKEYSESEKQVELIDPDDLVLWEKVMVLPFPKEKIDLAKNISPSDDPIFFDHTQLSKRYIPLEDFVQVVTRIMEKINQDLQKTAAFHEISENSEWDVL